MNKTCEQPVQFSVHRLVHVVEEDMIDGQLVEEWLHMDQNVGAVADDTNDRDSIRSSIDLSATGAR